MTHFKDEQLKINTVEEFKEVVERNLTGYKGLMLPYDGIFFTYRNCYWSDIKVIGTTTAKPFTYTAQLKDNLTGLYVYFTVIEENIDTLIHIVLCDLVRVKDSILTKVEYTTVPTKIKYSVHLDKLMDSMQNIKEFQ